MATLTAAGRLFRVDEESWRSIALTGTFAGATLVAIGAYAILAFDRFGVQGVVDPRATVRLLLAGFYGWLWLVIAAWIIGWFVFGTDTGFATVFRLYGNAHLPLVFVAIAIQVFSVVGRTLGPALLVAGLAGLIWMPAMLVGATRAASGFDTRRSALLVAGPYVIWLLTVGIYLVDQLGHLL